MEIERKIPSELRRKLRLVHVFKGFENPYDMTMQ